MKKPSLEQLKKDMEDKRLSADADAAAAYSYAYAAYAAADAYAAAKKKYEDALEQAPAESSDVTISRETAETSIVALKRANRLAELAGLAMQGYITATGAIHGPEVIAEWSIQNAEALLNELENRNDR